MTFSFSGNVFTQTGTDTDLSDNTNLGPNLDNRVVMENNPLYRMLHSNGNRFNIQGDLSWDSEEECLLLDGYSGATQDQPYIHIDNNASLTLGVKTTLGAKAVLSRGNFIVCMSNDTNDADVFRGERGLLTKESSAELSIFGGTIITDENVAIWDSGSLNDTETGFAIIEGTRFVNKSSLDREFRIELRNDDQYGSQSALNGVVINGFNITHRGLPPVAVFIIENGSINQLSAGPASSTLEKFDVSNNIGAIDVGFDGNQFVRKYNIHGSLTGSNIRAITKTNINSFSNRRLGILDVVAHTLIKPIGTDGAAIGSVAVFSRDTNNGERKNLNSQDDTADKTYYTVSNEILPVVTGIINRDETDNQTPHDQTNSLDMRGKNYPVNIAVENQSALQADVVSANSEITTLLNQAYFQLTDMIDAGNNGVWQAQENYGATTVGRILCEKTSTNPVNASAEDAIISIHGLDQFDIAVVRREFNIGFLSDTPLKGAFTSTEPQEIITTLVNDTSWSNTNSGNPLALSDFTTWDQVYDASKQWKELEVNIEFPTLSTAPLIASGTQIDVDAAGLDVVITDANQADVFDITSGVLTIEGNTSTGVTSGSKFNGINVGSSKEIEVQSSCVIDGGIFGGQVRINEVQNLTNITINGDLRLDTAGIYNFTNVIVTGNVFNDDASGNLTINAANSSLNTTESGTGNGQVNIANSVTIAITCQDVLGNAIIGARVFIEDNSSNEIINDLTDSNGEVSTSFNFLSDVAISGRAAKGSSSPFFKQSVITGQITSTGFSTTIVMVSDE